MALSNLNASLRKFLQETLGRYPIYRDAYVALGARTYAFDDPYRPVSDLVVRHSRLNIPGVPEIATAQGIVIELGSGKSQDPNTIKVDRYIYEPGCDVVADAMELPFPDNCADFIYHVALLEHVQKPWRVGSEMFRILKPGKNFAVDCAFLQAHHGYPHHYFNIAPDGLKYIFRQFEDIEIRSNTSKWDFIETVRILCELWFPVRESWKKELMPVEFTRSLICTGRKPN